MKAALPRILLGMIVTIVAAAAPVFAQNHDPAEPEESAPLVLTGTVLSKKCLSWNKDVAELELRLQFTNKGERPLILNSRDITSIGVKYFAFIDEEKDEVHLGGIATCNLRGYEPEQDQELVSNYPNSNFVVLSPGQSYVIEQTEVAPLIPSTTLSGKSNTLSDNYQIEVEVSTWDTLNPKLAIELQRKWKNVGVLWSATIRSEPIEFTFQRNRTCEE